MHASALEDLGRAHVGRPAIARASTRWNRHWSSIAPPALLRCWAGESLPPHAWAHDVTSTYLTSPAPT
jgi:hypothetical protein